MIYVCMYKYLKTFFHINKIKVTFIILTYTNIIHIIKIKHKMQRNLSKKMISEGMEFFCQKLIKNSPETKEKERKKDLIKCYIETTDLTIFLKSLSINFDYLTQICKNKCALELVQLHSISLNENILEILVNICRNLFGKVILKTSNIFYFEN